MAESEKSPELGAPIVASTALPIDLPGAPDTHRRMPSLARRRGSRALLLTAALAGAAGCGSSPAGGTGGDSATGATGSGGSTSSGPSTSASSGSGGTTTASTSSTTSSSGTPLEMAAEDCVDTINKYRATIGLAPYARWSQEETCAGQEADKDAETNVAHSAFGMCGEAAQDECPGWPGPPDAVVAPCLAQMWAEGPGPFATHGHYDNMSSTSYTMCACGFYTLPDGSVWATQDFK